MLSVLRYAASGYPGIFKLFLLVATNHLSGKFQPVLNYNCTWWQCLFLSRRNETFSTTEDLRNITAKFSSNIGLVAIASEETIKM